MVVVEALLLAFGVFVLGTGFKLLTGGAINISSLWLANGLTLGVLLTTPRGHWPLLLFASVTGSVAGALYLHADPQVIAWIAGFNMVEVLVAAWLLPAQIDSAAQLTRRKNFLAFLLIGVVLAPLVMVTLLGAYNYVTHQRFDMEVIQRVLVGHALGIVIMTPVTLALRTREVRRLLDPDVMPGMLVALAVLTLVTIGVFWQSMLPLLFLIFPPMLLVASRGGFVGTALALLLVVVVGTVATANNHGPIAMISALFPGANRPLFASEFVLLQIFVAALLVTLFPMIVSIAEGRRAQAASGELQNRLRLLMEHSFDVVILTDLDGRRLYASPAVRDVLGYEPDVFLQQTWRDYLATEDVPTVERMIRDARRNPVLRAMTVRVRHAAGHEIWIESHIKHFRDRSIVMTQAEQKLDLNCGPNGDEGFIVTVRDITRRREMEMALESANVELATLVWKDSLTGLANRRRFDEALQEAWQKALLGGWPLAVLMIDVDHFKQFNDCYGHQHGDLCLLGVSDAIASGLFHPEDLAARYGGEEFAVILQKTDTDDAAHVAERIRLAVHSMGRPHAVSPLRVLTVSIGVAASRAVAHGNPAAIVTAADEALYISKDEGRNRTTLLDVNWPVADADPAEQTAG